MCNFKNGFILCKCNDPRTVSHNKKSRRNKGKLPKEYKWELNKYMGVNHSNVLGLYKLPYSDIGNGLTEEFVEQELNARNCFDFEYEPQEGDNLIIEEIGSWYSISFIFRDGRWTGDHYNPFMYHYKSFDDGRLTRSERSE